MIIPFVLAQLLVIEPSELAPWRSYEEVFDLAKIDGRVLAATNGGLLSLVHSSWTREDSPAGLRGISGVEPITLTLADGRTVERTGGSWTAISETHREKTIAPGLLLGATGASSYDGPLPFGHTYTLLQEGQTLYAGTSKGLFTRHGSSDWTRVQLPSELPASRPNGFAYVGGFYVIGGIDGLFMGRPGNWTQICSDSIRQICSRGDEVWVAHGNGAVDKLSPKAGQLWPDALFSASKRPWTSALGQRGGTLLFGGQGGWTERGPVPIERFPPSLEGDVVLSIAGSGETRWIGTEKSGLFRFDGKSEKCWNPGSGLPDTTVTALSVERDGVTVGTAHSGLFQVRSSKILPMESPTERVTTILRWKGQLVVGGMDGCWIQKPNGWKSLATGGEETTSINDFNGSLAITTAQGIFFRS